MPAEVETMMYDLQEGVPWHGLGTPVFGAVDSEEALVKAGLMWAVEQQPIFVPNPPPESDGLRYDEVPGYVANVRSTDRAVLGIVSDRYRVVQNAEAFRWVDALLGEGVRYTTAGSLRGGRRIFLTAILPDEFKLNGDVTAPYLVFSNSHDGSTQIRVAITPVRVVCMNTLNLALRRAQRQWATFHTVNLQSRLREAAETLGLARRYLTALKVEALRLAERKVDLEEYVSKLLPLDPKAGKRAEEQVKQRRDLLLKMAGAENLHPFAGTAWQLINAVADYVAHAPPGRQTDTWRERRAERIIDGHPLLDAAYRLVSEN